MSTQYSTTSTFPTSFAAFAGRVASHMPAASTKRWMIVGAVAIAAVIIAVMLTVMLNLRRPTGFPSTPTAVCSLPLTTGGTTPYVIAPMTALDAGGIHDAVLAFDGQTAWCYDVTTQTMLIAGVPLSAAPTWLIGADGAALFGGAPWTSGISGATYVPAGGLLLAASAGDVIAQVLPGSSDGTDITIFPAQMLFPGARGLARVPGAAAAAATSGGTSFAPTASTLRAGETVTIRSVNVDSYWQVPEGVQPATGIAVPTSVEYGTPSAGVFDSSLQFVVAAIAANPVVGSPSSTVNSLTNCSGAVAVQLTSVASPSVSPGCPTGGDAPISCFASASSSPGTTFFVTPGPGTSWSPPEAGAPLVPLMPSGVTSSGVFLYPSNMAAVSGGFLLGAVRDGYGYPHILDGYLVPQSRFLIEAVPSTGSPGVRGLLLNGAAPSADALTAIEAHWNDGSVDAYDIPANAPAAGALGWFQADIPPLRVVPEAGARLLPLVGALYQWSLWSEAPLAQSVLRVTVDATGLVDVAGDASMPFSLQTLNVIWT